MRGGRAARRGRGLHALEDRRPSLALDLIEPFRPLIVDAQVLWMLNRGVIRQGDFTEVWDDDPDLEDRWDEEAETPPRLPGGPPANQDAEDGMDAAGAPGEGAAEGPEPGAPRVFFERSGVAKWAVAVERRLDERVLYPERGERLRYRDALREQARAWAREVRGEGRYVPLEPAS